MRFCTICGTNVLLCLYWYERKGVYSCSNEHVKKIRIRSDCYSCWAFKLMTEAVLCYQLPPLAFSLSLSRTHTHTPALSLMRMQSSAKLLFSYANPRQGIWLFILASNAMFLSQNGRVFREALHIFIVMRLGAVWGYKVWGYLGL